LQLLEPEKGVFQARTRLRISMDRISSRVLGTILKMQVRFLPTRDQMDLDFTWLRISMDRISDSDSEDAGSIPAGATKTV
jgi:hypothetical protein